MLKRRAVLALLVASLLIVQTPGVARAQVPPASASTGGDVATPSAAPPPPASSPPAALADEVHLKNGGMLRGPLLLRGTVVDMVPGDHATVLLPTGQSVMVEWSLIDRIERRAAGDAAPVAPPAPVALPPLPVRPAEPTAWVHVVAERPVVLVMRSVEGESWATACAAPCDRRLPLDHDYRVLGAGVVPSDVFRLAARPGERITLDVDVPSARGARAAGITLTSVGGAAVLVGLLGALGSSASEGTSGSSQSSYTTIATTLIGGILLATGIVLIRTKAGKATVLEEGSGEPAPRPCDDQAWLRLPGGPERSPVELAAPRANTVGGLTFRF